MRVAGRRSVPGGTQRSDKGHPKGVSMFRRRFRLAALAGDIRDPFPVLLDKGNGRFDRHDPRNLHQRPVTVLRDEIIRKTRCVQLQSLVPYSLDRADRTASPGRNRKPAADLILVANKITSS